MTLLSRLFGKFKSDLKARQSLWLLFVNFSGLPLGIAISILLARILGAEGFGDYNFFFSIFTFSCLIITLGFFQAGNRALVINQSNLVAKQYYGAMLCILISLFALLTLILLIYALVDPNFKSKNLTSSFIASLPLGFVFLSGQYVETLFQADNRINLLSLYRISTKLFHLILLVSLCLTNSINNNKILLITIYLYFFSHSLVFLLVVIKIKPSIINLFSRIKEIWIYNKSFGLNVYIGSVLAVGSASLSQILIGYFSISNSEVGFYTLALMFCAPLSLIPNTIATVYYKEFSRSAKISDTLIKFTLLISFIAVIILWLIIKPFILFFYGNEFESIVTYIYIVSLGVLAHGFGDMYNRYLGANGQSKSLRNSAFIVGIISVSCSSILIPLFGIYGAIVTSLLAGFVYFVVIYEYYNNYINSKF